ncbi:histone-lysine N-methyltransferase, H3 lysine-9 specific SUVH4-like isoform X2 [Populus nigra]|uniref:histone-lysine N-methyltransferase, H3 lysine-9 specific SUVH4-like isoform X2 n=1 Tax=Populus nigra TaxID=3691 RepID=UPI002B270FD2|nr:histone-lysine N-methyltransferase, H3 lysine-9 specific SUVH4-like isoform X2 [Populus nigra]
MKSPCKESKIPSYKRIKQEPSSEAIDVSVTKNIAQRVQKVESKGSLERRCSPRLKNKPQEKRPCYDEGQSMKLDDPELDICKKEVEGESTGHGQRRWCPRLESIPDKSRPKHDVCKKETGDYNRKRHLESPGDNAGKRWSFINHPMQEWLPDIDRKGGEDGLKRSGLALGSLPFKFDDTEIELENNANLKWTDYQSFVADSIKQKACTAVKETARTFNNHHLSCVQEEEKRYEKVEARDPQVADYTDNKGNSSTAKCTSKQPILKEISEASKKNEQSYTEKQVAYLPGITVGHKFFSRDDMVATGFRGHWLNGIDYIRKLCGKLGKNNEYSSLVAVAIVLSGQYQDGVDCLNEVVYTGQGRNNMNGSKSQTKDQVMHCSNLALENNMEQSVPVRVICEHKRGDNQSGKVYTYCGLYKVVRCWSFKRASGFTVSKYCLKRLQGQPKVEIDEVCFEQERTIGKLHGLVCEDISFGKEDIPIPVINVIDNPPIAPPGFKYIKSVQVARNVIIPPSASGCDCKGKCTNPRSCSCARLNGFDFPYVDIDGGRLIEAKDVVFECGPGCSCGPSCINRVSQRGLKYQLERRQGDGSAPAIDPLKKVDVKMDESESEFCIDAISYGNVTRFINHSCQPNLFVQCILSTHHDIRLARIVLFAADDILPMQELTYDYGYALDSVVGPDGKLKQSPCYCGTDECRGRLY